ncbi:MAG: serine/threonine-protein kinase [Pseudomonadota bacterium]
MFVSERANTLFDQALALDPDSRVEYITRECADDHALFAEVSSLLAAADQSANYFESIVERVSLSALVDDEEAGRQGKVIGRWRLLDCIGRGGMGSVYLAEHAGEELDKRAAVKLLPLGMDSDRARARFLQERKILARLVHDNIARLLDGGVTDDGVPYFVMDYVDGQAIDVYCEQQGQTVEQRLRLVLDIAAALQYAHRNLVVHRDLKPGNVLVESEGRVRLLDFGIAKVLEPDGLADAVTHYAQRPVTPAFASPEMLSGEAVDVTTDVYSLGALTYLLLTGHLPLSYDGLSIAETIERARNTVPAPPSRLSADVHRDLDAVLGKALAREPQDRYSSIDNFASDLRAYLEGRPVNAREPTAMYRLTRFAQRNLPAVSASFIGIAVLVAATVLAVGQAREAERQRDAVLLQEQRTRASNEFFGGLIDELDATPMTSLQLLDRGTVLLQEQYGLEQAFMGYTLYEVARRYGRLNETDKQLELLHQALSVAESNGDVALQAAVLCRLNAVVAPRDSALAGDYFLQGKELFLSLDSPGVEEGVDCLRMFARDAAKAGDTGEALAYLQEAKTLVASQSGVSVDIEGPLLGYLAHVYFDAGRMQESLDTLDEALTLLEDAGRGNSLGYVRVASNRAVLLNAIGRLPESLAAWEDLVDRARAGGYRQRGAASLLNQYAGTLARVGRLPESADIFQEARQLAGSAGDLRNVAISDLGLARASLAAGQFDQAIDYLDSLRRYAEQDKSADTGVTRAGELIRIRTYRQRGDLDLALDAVKRMLAELGYPDAERGRQLISTVIEAASVHQARGEFVLAEGYATDVIARLSARAIGQASQSIDVGRAHVHRAEIRASRGDAAGALSDLDRGLPVLLDGLGEEHKEAIEARALKAQLSP